MNRQQQLEEWKARKAAEKAAAAGGAGGATGCKLQQHAQQVGKPLASLVPRPGKMYVMDKENSCVRVSQQGTGWRALPDSQKQQLESTFDLLQERMKALKRDSMRPSISGTNAVPAQASAAATAAATTAGTKHSGQLAGTGDSGAFLRAPASPPRLSAASAATPIPEVAALSAEPDLSSIVVPGASASVATTGAALVGVGGIAARLESLKRESLRPSVAGSGAAGVPTGPQQAQVLFETGGQFDGQMLTKLALALFEDEGFKALCEKGLNAQLTRSKDGATEETKIKELAGMVKLLRRGMKELQTKVGEFVAAACRFEREVVQQVESVKLAAESERMQMQAEVARVRSEMAGLSAEHKAARSQWQEALAAQQGHEQRYKLEVDRLDGEKAALQDKLRRVEASKQEVEEQLRRALREMSTDLNRLKADTNKDAEERYAMQQAAERKQVALVEALAEAQARISELEDATEVARRQADGLQRGSSRLERTLEDLREQRDALQVEQEKLHKEFNAHRQAHEKLVADSAGALRELEETREELSRTNASLKSECAAHLATRQQLNSLVQSLGDEQQAWQSHRAAMETERAAAAERELGVAAERDHAAAELAAVSRRVHEYEGMMAAAANEIEQLRAEVSASSAAARESQAAAATAQEQTARLQSQLDAEATAASAARREAQDKGEKLAQLEAELEALQECTIGLGSGDQKEMLTRMVSKIAALEAAVAAEGAKRREIHNQLVEMKGNIRVFCRIRPSPRSVVHCLPDGATVKVSGLDSKDHTFTFDRVFGPEAVQRLVFDEVAELVQSALDGFKVCLFSYGQTGAGKTHTMQGSRGGEGQGIIPRSISKILAAVAKLREQGWEYKLQASFVEVYNETLRDLLVDPAGNRREGGKIAEQNAIQHQPSGGHTLVLGAARVSIESEEDAAAVVRRAAAARAVEATAMNAVSSRSHSVFMLYTTGRHEASGTLLQGSLNLVDLAGSERLARSQAEGARAKEACNINKSLSSLGDVFAALASKAPHVPYRNSKLTHLLQPCLGGSGKTLMFVNINPEPESAQESLCSLRFAAKVNACETAAKGGAQRNISVLDGIGLSAAEERRLSTAPNALKRKAGLPAAPGRGIPRAKLN